MAKWTFSEMILFWKKPRLNFLVLGTGTACNLRCRDCGNFVPNLKPTLYDLDAVARDLERVAQLVEIGMVQLQGGEPLLHPDLHLLVARLAGLGFAGRLQVATNGMLTLAPELASACRAGRVTLRISNYNLDAQRVAALERQCLEEGVACRTYSFAAGDDTWLRLGGVDTERDDDDDSVRSRFRSCPFRACFTLEDGLLGRCSRSVVSHLTGQHPLDRRSILDVRHTQKLRKPLRRYLNEQEFMTSCRYCLGGDGGKLPPAIQLQQSRG